MNLNIGCGPNGQIENFVNIDNSKAVLLAHCLLLKKILYKLRIINKQKYEAHWKGVRWMDASRCLPFRTESVSKIYTSHFLEHVPLEKGKLVLAECYRVLKNGGVIRLVLPDLLWHAKRYVTAVEKILNGDVEKYSSYAHDRFLNSIYGAYLKTVRYGLEHCYMYDVPTILCLLRKTGFTHIRVVAFREGEDSELGQYDNRPEDSLHVECWKNAYPIDTGKTSAK